MQDQVHASPAQVTVLNTWSDILQKNVSKVNKFFLYQFFILISHVFNKTDFQKYQVFHASACFP